MQQLKAFVHLPAVHSTEPGAAGAPAVHLNELCSFKLSPEKQGGDKTEESSPEDPELQTCGNSQLRRAALGGWRFYTMLQEGKESLAEGASKLVTERLRPLLLPSLVISLFCESEVSKSASKASKDGSRKHRTRVS